MDVSKKKKTRGRETDKSQHVMVKTNPRHFQTLKRHTRLHSHNNNCHKIAKEFDRSVI